MENCLFYIKECREIEFFYKNESLSFTDFTKKTGGILFNRRESNFKVLWDKLAIAM